MALEEFNHFFKESYGPEEDHTTGTSEFDESYNNDPDDCYCESFDLERLSPDIQLRPADEYYLDNIIEWKIQTILEGYPDEQPSPEEYNKISNYVKNETPKMLDDTRIIMYDNDQPIGMIIAYQKDQDWFIDDIFLIPEFRHKGIGRMILENEISNHNQLALWVYKSNIHAISLYESLGFKVEEAIKERQMMRLRKTDVEMTKGWRVTYQGIGIYEALKNAMFTQTGSPAAWMAFINSDACNWLPKPPSYGNDNKSFFTEEGFNRFNELVLPIIAQYIDQTKIYIEEIMVPTNQIVYSDEFQFVTSDTIQESYTDTKSVSILYKRWSTKNGEQYKPIAKFWDIVEKHVNASKLQGYGTDWTGYGTDFLYGIIFKNGNIPKEVIDDVKKAFPDMIVDNSFSIPSSFEETYSGDTKNIDSLYDKIWSKGFLSHELEEFTDDGKCTIRVSYKNKVSQESSIPRSNEVYTNGGSIEKINNLQFDKVYFGSPNKLSTTMKLDGPLFVSPYPGIASIFSVRPQNLSKYGIQRGQRVNRDYDEWDRSLIDTVLQKPLRELHVRLQGDGLNIKPTTELVSGYLYTIDVTPEIKDHIYQSSKMSKVFEFCIDKIDSITFSDIKKINVRMTVTGGNRPVQEAYDAITGKEIPIDHAYTMDEMKERTFSFKDLFSKEKRAKRYIEKRITKLLPLFMTDINKLLSSHNNDTLDRSLVMDMYYPRTVIVTHHDPATGMTYTTTEQQPTDEMVRLSFVISFFRKIIKKQHMMDMLDNPDVVYGLREELDAMFNCIHDIFKIKSTKEDLEKLFGIITSISNDINSFIDSFESNNEVSTMFDSIDYFSDVDVEPITIQEAKLPSKKRNKLPDSDFALVYTDANGKKIRKYPIHDEAHCKAAAHMFPRGVPLKYKAEVARKILRRAHKFGIDTSGWKNLNNFTKRSDK